MSCVKVFDGIYFLFKKKVLVIKRMEFTSLVYIYKYFMQIFKYKIAVIGKE